MNAKQLMSVIGDAQDTYIGAAIATREGAGHTKRLSLKGSLLLAAIIAMMLMLVGCTVAYVNGWFTDFFANQSDEPLSSEQIAYIEENEQVIDIPQMQNGWTVELESAIHDGRTAYVILAVTAPEDIDLENIENGEYLLGEEFAWLVSNNQGIALDSMHQGWEDDGDELPNTQNYFIRWEPVQTGATADPFSPDVEWSIHIENILYEYENTEYLQELLNGKYNGQEDVMFTGEESEKLRSKEIAAEGPWDFAFTFTDGSTGIELVSSPMTIKGYVSRYAYETAPSYEDVTITSFVLNSFSAVLCHETDGSVTFADQYGTQAVAVMNDSTQINLDLWSCSKYETVLNSSIPIVLDEVAYVQLGDSTILPMPEQP